MTPAALVLAATALSGCAKDRATANVTLGQTTVAALKQQIGEPATTQMLPSEPEVRRQLEGGQPPSTAAPRVQVLNYPDRGESFQASAATGQSGEEGVISARSRDPEGNERTLQYWRHRWVGVEKREQWVVGSKDKHGNSKIELSVPSLNKAVIYDPARDAVEAVVEYGRK